MTSWFVIKRLAPAGESVGPANKADELIDAFITFADKENCRPVFYQVAAEHLATYVDYGFTLSKLGEEARVNLTEFSLEGPPRKRLRQSQNKSIRDGLTLQCSGQPHSTELMTELKGISHEWLQSKNAQEKSFSLGRFSESYLQQFPMALVKHNGSTVAFANVMQSGRHHRFDASFRCSTVGHHGFSIRLAHASSKNSRGVKRSLWGWHL